MKHLNKIGLILCCILPVACRRYLPQVPDSPCEIVLATRGELSSGASYTDTTYRAQLFYRGEPTGNSQRKDSLISPYTGTYCGPSGGNAWLTPCSVDEKGAYAGSEGSQYGLRAGRNHNYYLFLCSPAVKFVEYGDACGLEYERDGQAWTHPALSPAALVTTSGLNLQDNYRYSLADDMVLKEYRSRMAFSVACGDEISHARLRKLEIAGLRKNAVLRPFAKDFHFEDSPENYDTVVVYDNSCGLYLASGEAESSITGLSSSVHLDSPGDNAYFQYVLSDDYKSMDKDNRYIRKPPEMHITLLNDDGDPVFVDPVEMPFIFLPQKNYFFTVTISSVFLKISVTACDWGGPYVSEGTVADDSPAITLTFNISDWTCYSNGGSIENGSGTGAGESGVNAGGVVPGGWTGSGGGAGTIE